MTTRSIGYYVGIDLPKDMEAILNALDWDAKARLGAALSQIAIDERDNGLIDEPFPVEILPQPERVFFTVEWRNGTAVIVTPPDDK